MDNNYIRYVSNNIHASVDKIFNELETARVTPIPDLNQIRFFLDINFRNKVQDLVYFREEIIKPHLKLCMAAEAPDNMVEVMTGLYNDLIDIETKSFIQVMRVNKPWYGLSEDHKKKLNKLAIDILNEIS